MGRHLVCVQAFLSKRLAVNGKLRMEGSSIKQVSIDLSVTGPAITRDGVEAKVSAVVNA